MYLLVIAIELTGAGCCLCKAGLPSVWILWNYEHLGSEKSVAVYRTSWCKKDTGFACELVSCMKQFRCCILLWLIHFVEGRIPPGAPPWMVAAGAWNLSCRMLSRRAGIVKVSQVFPTDILIRSHRCACMCQVAVACPVPHLCAKGQVD